ncbi:beta-N-acetylhexosaminidase [Aquimarina sediminis]|uniref:beta-N-acetylhexosaminidase n=1 Tax=Aquimarina sediminis TaxID=2070536 RepID=UPI001F4E6B93|nr:beta-N-acetylhexosaminidase [Aquimarina sediminis]
MQHSNNNKIQSLMKNIHHLVLTFFSMCFVLASCQKPTPAPTPKDLLKESFIPKPAKVEAFGSSFRIYNETQIAINSNSNELKRVAEYFAQILRPATGFDFNVVQKEEESKGDINFIVSEKLSELGNEGYTLTITDDKVVLLAHKSEGIFRGIQTIRQLFPPEIERTEPQNIIWELASGIINDQPNYSYRGSMLDVSRHFFTVEEVKQYIDWLARYKMNVMHLHLTDDQGWRIEIKKWPKLTEIGGSTEVGGEKGGYYTQEQYKDLVRYASERYITIIPEIDVPGHTNAALASYPELNCDDKAPELYTGTKVGFSSFCIEKEITYQFMNDVISEIASITPGPYIHIGGDEPNATKKEDYILFINKVQDIVSDHKKIMIGWNEVVSAEIKPTTIVQFWTRKEEAKEALEHGAKLIMSPAKRAYLDMKYDSITNPQLGLNWAGYIEVDKAYNWQPETYVPEIGKDNILGIECPLWTETVSNMDEMEFLVFPRLLGYSEIGWSKSDIRNWEDYKTRLGYHSLIFKELGIDYYASKLIDWK